MIVCGIVWVLIAYGTGSPESVYGTIPSSKEKEGNSVHEENDKNTKLLIETMALVKEERFKEYDNKILTDMHIPTTMIAFNHQPVAILIDTEALEKSDPRFIIKSKNNEYLNINALLDGGNIFLEKNVYVHYGGLLKYQEEVKYNDAELLNIEIKPQTKLKTLLITDYSGETIGIVLTVI